MVDRIDNKRDHFELITKKVNYKTLKVVLAIGKSGNARMLNVPGENLPKVYNRLFDPADAKEHDVPLLSGKGASLGGDNSAYWYSGKSTIRN